MKGASAAVTLGLRSRRNSTGALFATLVEGAALIAAAVAAILLAGTHLAYEHRADRDAARLPTGSEEFFAAMEPALDGSPDQRQLLEARARLSAGAPFVLQARFARLSDGLQHSVVLVVRQQDGVAPPPGLPRWPLPGEAFLSSQLLTDGAAEGIATRYGKLAGTIAPEGLTSANERLAYVNPLPGSVPAGQMVPYQAFGGPSRHWWDDPVRVFGDSIGLTPAPYVLVLFLLLAVLPAGGLCLAAGRVTAPARNRRLVTLRTLGASPWQERFVQFGELLPALVVTTVASAGLVSCLVTTDITLPITGYISSAEALRARWIWLVVAALLGLTGGALLVVGRRARAVADSTRPESRDWKWPLWSAFLTPLGLVAAGRLPDLVDPSRRTTWYVSYLACTLLVLLGTPMLLSWIVKGTAAILETWSAPRLSPSLLITCRALLRNPAAVASPAAVIVLSAVIAFQGQFVTNTLGDRARQALAVSTALEGRVAVAMYFDGVRGAQEAIRRTPKGVHVLLVSESDPPEVMGTCEALADVGLTCPPSGQPQIAHLIGGDLQFLPLSIPIDQGTVEVLQGDPAAAAPRFTQQWLVFHSRTAINTEALQEAVVPTTWPNDGPDSPGYSYAGAGFAAAHESTWISLTALFALALLAIAIGCGTYSATLGLGKVLAPIGVLTARPGPFVVAAAALAALPTALGGVVAGLLGLRLTQIPVDAGIALPYGGTLLAGFVGVCIVAAAIQCLAAAFVVRTAAWSWRP